MTELDELIVSAHGRAVEREWKHKDVPIRIGGNYYWLTAQVPARLQAVLEHLPGERESGTERRMR